jgi:hypothetical protein
MGVQQSGVQRPKRDKSGAIAIDSGLAQIWLGLSLVNAMRAGYSGLWRRPSPASDCFPQGNLNPGLEIQGLPLIQGLNSTLAFPGFHHFDRLFALPRPRDWASVAPLLNGPPQQPYGFEYKDFP